MTLKELLPVLDHDYLDGYDEAYDFRGVEERDFMERPDDYEVVCIYPDEWTDGWGEMPSRPLTVIELRRKED